MSKYRHEYLRSRIGYENGPGLGALTLHLDRLVAQELVNEPDRYLELLLPRLGVVRHVGLFEIVRMFTLLCRKG